MLSLLLATLLTQATMSPTSDLSTNRVRATGTTSARTLKDHLSDRVSVKSFGAVGNGSTNDTTALQAAADAMEAAGGGTLYFPAGTYMGCINLGSKVNLEGAGIEATRIKMPSGANCAAVIQTKNFAAYDTGCNYAVQMACSASGSFRNHIRDLTVDGNKAANTSGRGVQIYGKGFYLDSLSIENAASDGLYTAFNGPDWFDSPSGTLAASISRLKIELNGGAGWVFKGPHDSHVHDVDIFGNGGWGWDLWFSANAVYVNTYVNDQASPGATGGIWCHNVCAIYGSNIIGSNGTGRGGLFDTGGSTISASSWGAPIGLELRNSSNQRISGVIANTSVAGLVLNGAGASGRLDFVFGGNNQGVWIDAVGGSYGATSTPSSIDIFSYSDEGVLFASSIAPPGETRVVAGTRTGIYGKGRLHGRASYDMQDAVAFTVNDWTDMIYNTRVSDSGDDFVTFSSTTWQYTAPTDGEYLVDAMVSIDGTTTTAYFSLWVDGAEKKRSMGSTPSAGGTMSIGSVLHLTKGNVVKPRIWVNQPGRSSLTSRIMNWITIDRLSGK